MTTSSKPLAGLKEQNDPAGSPEQLSATEAL